MKIKHLLTYDRGRTEWNENGMELQDWIDLQEIVNKHINDFAILGADE